MGARGKEGGATGNRRKDAANRDTGADKREKLNNNSYMMSLSLNGKLCKTILNSSIATIIALMSTSNDLKMLALLIVSALHRIDLGFRWEQLRNRESRVARWGGKEAKRALWDDLRRGLSSQRMLI